MAKLNLSSINLLEKPETVDMETLTTGRGEGKRTRNQALGTIGKGVEGGRVMGLTEMGVVEAAETETRPMRGLGSPMEIADVLSKEMNGMHESVDNVLAWLMRITVAYQKLKSEQ